MKFPKLNNIVLIFVLLIVLLVGAIFQIIQSEQFAKLVSERLTQQIQKKMNANIEFKKLKIGVFPPSTVLQKGEIAWRKNKTGIRVKASEIGIYFDFFDFLLSRLTIDKVKLRNGEIHVIDSKERASFENLKIDSMTDVFNFYLDMKSKIKPAKIKNLELFNIDFLSGNNKVGIDHLDLGIYKNILLLNALVDPQNIDQLRGVVKPDSLEINLQLTREKIRVKKLELKKRFNTLSYHGDLHLENKKPKIKGQLFLKGNIKELLELSKLKKWDYLKTSDGYMNAKLNIDTQENVNNATFNLKLKKIKSEYINLDNIVLEGQLENNILSVKKAMVDHNNGNLVLVKSFDLFDFSNSKLLLREVDLKLKNLFTNDFLYPLRDILNGIKGRVSGGVKVLFNKTNISFVTDKQFRLENFGLFVDQKEPLLKNDGFVFSNTLFKLAKDLSVFSMSGQLIADKIVGQVDGVFNSRGLNITGSFKNFDFERLGPIFKTKIHGEGPSTITINGPYNNVVFDINANLKKFNVVDINFDNLNCNAKLFLKNVSLDLKKCKAMIGSGSLNGEGQISFLSDGALNFFVDYKDVPYDSMFTALPNVFKKDVLKFEQLDFSNSGFVKIRGDFNSDNLLVEGVNEMTDIYYRNETLDKVSSRFRLKGGELQLSDISVLKNAGVVTATASFNLRNDFFEYDAKLANFKLVDFGIYRLMNLGLESKFEGEFYGSGTFKEFSTKSHIRFYDGHIGGVRTKDSFLTFYSNESEIFGSGSLFDNLANFEGLLNFSKRSNHKKSYFKSKIKSKNLKVVAGLLSKHNIVRKDLNASMDGEIDLSFDIKNFSKLNLDMKLNSFNGELGKEKLRINPQKNKVEIKNGKIIKWDLLFNGTLGKVESLAEGSLFETFKISQAWNVNPYILSIVTDKIENLSGQLNGRHVLIGKKEELNNFLEMEGHDFDLRSKAVPGRFSKVSFKLLSEDNKVIVDALKGEYGNGLFSGSGLILLKFPFPEVKVDFKFDNSRIPLFKKSNITVSGQGNLAGSRPPYILNGFLEVLRGDILDEFAEIAKSTITYDEYSQFLPNKKETDALTYIRNNLQLKLNNPISIKNSFSDLRLFGGANVSGKLSNPLLRGEFKIVPQLSKFFFKGHDFLLTEGVINFVDDKRKEPPRVSFVGECKINEYDINLRVSGNTKNVDIAMDSDPPLSRNDIFSLLTLGVTSDISKDLDEKDRQSITTLGIGSLIIDQLRISEGIGNNLGLRLSVQPEFIEDEGSLLEGKSGSSSLSSKYKTATKIKLQKKINKKVDISLSSTLSSDNEQKQEMNINYNLNQSFSVEGVYEINSSDEDEGDSTNSLGFDLKFRKSFD